MLKKLQHYINGSWVDSTDSQVIDVINPATEVAFGQISDGTEEDLNKAVKAADESFPSFSRTTSKERFDLFNRIVEEYEIRKYALIQSVTTELAVPLKLSETAHYNMGMQYFKQAAKELETYEFEKQQGETLIRKEPIGVSGLITPWNFPTNQTSTKIASAFAAG